MSYQILGLGTALPRGVLPQGRALELIQACCCREERQRRIAEKIFTQSGVQTRHSVLHDESKLTAGQTPLAYFYPPAQSEQDRGPGTAERMLIYEREAPQLALQACQEALKVAQIAPEQITHLITVSCTGFFAPGVEFELIRALGLPPNSGRFHVGFMGCHGALNGLRLAQALCQEPGAHVLLCAVELCSLHLQYEWTSDNLVANSLFADGAAALVARAAPPNTSSAKWQVAAAGSCHLPDTRDAMSWRVGSHGFSMTLAREVPDLIERHLKPWLTEWLHQQHLRLDQVGSWAVHPGGPRILDATAAALGLSEIALKESRLTLARCGNMSSPTVLFILKSLIEQHAPRPCVALGFGPGLALEASLLV